MSSPRWPYYLITNPCCSTSACGTCVTDPCGTTCTADPCHTYNNMSDHLAYTGANLPCTGIDTCDTLTVAIQKIEELLCQLSSFVGYTTTTTTTIA